MTEDHPETIEPEVVDGEPSSPSTEELLARLQDAERERDEVLDNLRRVAADFDNYRKRVAREQAQLHTRAGERVVVKLLPVLDDLVRAFPTWLLLSPFAHVERPPASSAPRRRAS